ncbi:RNA ligase [compost metagenome]
MRKLASIQEITNVKAVENSDFLDVVTVLGWRVVVKRGTFKVGDRCIYFEIDSILPQIEEFKAVPSIVTNKFILRTARLRGQLSQGLCWGLELLPEGDYVIGDDVTELLGVQKYEKLIPVNMEGISAGFFPVEVKSPGEVRIQTEPGLLKEFKGLRVARTIKYEGTCACYNKIRGEKSVCNHTHKLIEDEKNIYWRMAYKYKLMEILDKYDNISIQGEIIGPGIYGNPVGADEVELVIFRVIDLNTSYEYEPLELIAFCAENELQCMEMDLDVLFDYNTVEEVLDSAKLTYSKSGFPVEGVVYVPMKRVYSEILCHWLRMKVINNEYLLGEWKKKRRGK